MSNSNEQILDHLALETRPRWRGPMFWLGAFVLLLILLLVMAPSIATQSTIVDYAISRIVPADTAVVSVQSVRAGWFAPLKITGLRVLDGTGNPLIEAERIEGNRTLLQLLKNSSDLGMIVVQRPTVHLQLRDDGSNLEDTITKLMAGMSTTPSEATPSQPSALAAKLKLIDASVIATEIASVEAPGTATAPSSPSSSSAPNSSPSWTISGLNAVASLPATIEEDWIVEGAGTLNGQAFSFTADTPLSLATEAWPLGPTGRFTMNADRLPLSPLRYASMRSGQPIQSLDGTMSVNATATWKATTNSQIPALLAVGSATVRDLRMTETSLIGDDVLTLATATITTKANIQDDVVTLQQCDFQSDFGNASLQTAARLEHLSDPNAILDVIRKQQLTTNGRLDVAQLSKALPQTLKIRDDVEVASGVVTWNLNSTVSQTATSDGQATATNATPNSPAAVTRWSGALQTEDVQILRSGQPIDWRFPLTMHFAVTDAEEIELENLTAQSDFFSVIGSGKLREGSFQARADLERLVFQLSQVVDTSDIYVRGQMHAYLKWTETEANQLSIDARSKLSQFVMTQNEQMLWQEEELTAMLAATATLDGQNVQSLDAARFDVVSAGDFMVAQLQQPVANPDVNCSLPVAGRLQGDLSSWFARLQPLGIVEGWEVSGKVDATTQVTANQRGVAVHRLTADMSDFRALTDGIAIIEPTVRMETAGTVDLTTFACRFPNATIASQTVSLGAHNVSVDMEPNFVVAGDIGYQADIERLMNYMPADPEQPATQQISGIAAGRVQVRSQGETSNFQLDGKIENLRVVDLSTPAPGLAPGGPAAATSTVTWQEPEVTLIANGQYNAVQDQLQLQDAIVSGQAISLNVNGTASQVSVAPVVDITGDYNYNLEGLTALLGDVLGPDISLTGTHQQQFIAKGPIFPEVPTAAQRVSEDFVASAGAGWQSANAYNIPLGPTQVDAKLAGGVMKLGPLEVAVGEGILRAAPVVFLNTEPMWMTLEPQTIADRVRITPEMTGAWMKYIAPLLADATNAEGTFSVGVTKAEIPLMDPTAGQVEGEFIIHGGALGPGPLATQFIELASNVKRMIGKGDSRITDPTNTWVELSPQQVTFQVAENRVYHEGFEMRVDGVPIRTRGSVGMLDESISVMADVPIMDEWIDGTPALRGLRGQIISIPVSGTTSNPRLDQQALARISTQLARSAATGYIQDQLGGKLQEKLGNKLQQELGAGSIDEAIGGAQEKLNNSIQNEIGKQLNKLFK